MNYDLSAVNQKCSIANSLGNSFIIRARCESNYTKIKFK